MKLTAANAFNAGTLELWSSSNWYTVSISGLLPVPNVNIESGAFGLNWFSTNSSTKSMDKPKPSIPLKLTDPDSSIIIWTLYSAEVVQPSGY